jgi:hypothetical protein
MNILALSGQKNAIVMPEAYQEAHPLIVKNLPHGQRECYARGV